MKLLSITTTLFLAFAVSGTNLYAQDKTGMPHSMQGMGGMGGMSGMMHMSPEQMDTHMRSMQAHMLMMHDYSNKILAEKDPEKKQKLKDEQLELMKAHHMQMMAHRQRMMKMDNGNNQ